MKNLSYFLLFILVACQGTSFGMEFRYSDTNAELEIQAKQKEETKQWLLSRIKPINAGRFNTVKGARSNCTLVAEECVKVLAGLKEPEKVPARSHTIDMIAKTDDSGRVVSFEVEREEQAQLITQQEFIDTIDLVNNAAKTDIDLTTTFAPTIKYITSNKYTIIDDIKNLPGTCASKGQDKKLAGLIYYFYEGIEAGHLANFYRDEQGNIFFVDAQNETVSATPPTKVLKYSLKYELFFFPLAPKSGYFVKKETPDISIIKKEPNVGIKEKLTNSQTGQLVKSLSLKRKPSELSEQANKRQKLFEEFQNRTSFTDKELFEKTQYVDMIYRCPLCPLGIFEYKNDYHFIQHMTKIHDKKIIREIPAPKNPELYEEFSSKKIISREQLLEKSAVPITNENKRTEYKCPLCEHQYISHAYCIKHMQEKHNKIIIEETVLKTVAEKFHQKATLTSDELRTGACCAFADYIHLVQCNNHKQVYLCPLCSTIYTDITHNTNDSGHQLFIAHMIKDHGKTISYSSQTALSNDTGVFLDQFKQQAKTEKIKNEFSTKKIITLEELLEKNSVPADNINKRVQYKCPLCEYRIDEHVLLQHVKDLARHMQANHMKIIVRGENLKCLRKEFAKNNSIRYRDLEKVDSLFYDHEHLTRCIRNSINICPLCEKIIPTFAVGGLILHLHKDHNKIIHHASDHEIPGEAKKEEFIEKNTDLEIVYPGHEIQPTEQIAANSPIATEKPIEHKCPICKLKFFSKEYFEQHREKHKAAA